MLNYSASIVVVLKVMLSEKVKEKKKNSWTFCLADLKHSIRMSLGFSSPKEKKRKKGVSWVATWVIVHMELTE